MTVSKTTNACHSYGTTILRGGRLIKWKGQVASLSPSLGQLVASVSPVALGRALMVGANRAATAAVLGSAGLIVTTSGASAACTPGDPGVYTCSGAMGNGDGDIDLRGSGNLLDVTVSPSTTFNVNAGNAFDLNSNVGATFTNSNPEVTITGAVDGIDVYNTVGAISITTTGETKGSQNIGISAINANANGTSLTINAATTSGGLNGIRTFNSGDGALEIKTTGTTTGSTNEGIYAFMSNTASTGDLTINAANTEGGTNGIYAKNYGTGALGITTTGTTTGGVDGI